MDTKRIFLMSIERRSSIVIHQKGFLDPEFLDHIYRLKKALYGLKQAPRAWYDKLSSFLIEHGFTKDFLKRFANLMKNNFEMSMMGKLKFFLRLQVHQSPRGIFISQSQYAIELLKKHGLDECVSMSTPMTTERLNAVLQGTPTDQTTYRRMIGGLMYLTASRPDIAFATFVCARYQARPTVKHLKEDSRFELIAYLDADHAGCKDDCKSISGGLQFLGGKLVSWSSKKQDCTAMSTAEAEYYHFIKEHVEKGIVEIYFVGTEYQLVDLFTKALPKERFEYLVHRIEVNFWPGNITSRNQSNYDSALAAFSSVPWIYNGTVLEHTFERRIDNVSAQVLCWTRNGYSLLHGWTFRPNLSSFHKQTANNHNAFVPPPSFSDMVPFYTSSIGNL
ncbi:retrovirus-related pol polyprotein from transposon TNT 1-94 [Tanacetum coccineum]|uniref:Retrovirus-related pol polyprotein from transposon TNT 1-94 n=1 Tax=Tanacetum coccineum TaxID=301880 RepID=A0ABQ5G728_9ASTR